MYRGREHSSGVHDAVRETLAAVEGARGQVTHWLIALLSETAALSDHNNMTERSLAAIFAPLLYPTKAKGGLDAVRASQAIVQLLAHAIAHHAVMKSRGEGGGKLSVKVAGAAGSPNA